MYQPTAILILSFTLRTLPVLSLAHPGPKPTDPSSTLPDSIGWTPKPTAAPFLNSPLELRRRQNYAPANTCGWIDGNADDPFYCGDGYACSANGAAAYFGCCSTDVSGDFVSSDCAYIATGYSGCYDYTSAFACTGVCYDENRVCESTLPYCYMATINLGSEILTNYDCATDIYVRALDVETTVLYTSALDGGSSAAATSSFVPPLSSPTISPTSPITPSTQPTISSTSTSPVPTPTATSTSSKSAAGKIAGGVVGGIAGLALVLGGVIFGLHKRKQKQRQVVAPEISQTM